VASLDDDVVVEAASVDLDESEADEPGIHQKRLNPRDIRLPGREADTHSDDAGGAALQMDRLLSDPVRVRSE
jgi:hypothetical protein